ncbi:MAG TPA: HEAT repeat domain-containing protein [Phycisphaerae bacterium]|nr:HEAT repeat domain-containing protein [Phycisphaerae bacterium]HOJ52938.1 HEAT repeat domain-containing protein [Phycisphaerae bacterium]HOL24675.1 HEAT repeat domain-containing protein [Phycisphaerae bacterium]HPP19211.1 HEAT repeat domain-containing protein [Phycisphaerae bacterium]HPU31402.1 HEAT repeat domain-containing protein [Phycisphaerae bacterium]
MPRHWMGSVLSLALLIVPATAGAQSVSDLLAKALYQEKTAGDLDAAIKIYQSIIEQDKVSRPAVAQAHYRLGLCLARKGDDAKAREAFETVVKNYADQKTLAAEARKELAKLKDAGSPPVGVTGAEARQLLDPQTRRDIAELEKESGAFGELFRSGKEAEKVYMAAPEAEKHTLFQQWIRELDSSDAPTRSRAIIALGLIRHRQAVRPLIAIIKEPTQNNQFRWLAVRALGQIGDSAAVPVLIDLIDHHNWNTQVCAKVALAEITGVYFGQDKDKWRAWWKERSTAGRSGGNGRNPLAPAIVRTSPKAFDDAVPATLSELTVTFDRRMMDKSWSWTGGGETFPKRTGDIHYDASLTTCTMPVKLEPGKVYWVGINSPSHKKFQTAAHVPAPWYVILFATADQDGKPTPIPAEMLEKARTINAAAEKAASDARAATSKAPVVLRTSPRALDGAVPATLKELTVTFDRKMMDKSWSWTGGGETYPKTTGRPSYDAARTTCKLPVELEPGKVYWVGVNAASHHNFKSAEGVPAPWYVILFATADKDGKPTPIPADMLARASAINAAHQSPAGVASAPASETSR